jgi:hypothetical protein
MTPGHDGTAGTVSSSTSSCAPASSSYSQAVVGDAVGDQRRKSSGHKTGSGNQVISGGECPQECQENEKFNSNTARGKSKSHGPETHNQNKRENFEKNAQRAGGTKAGSKSAGPQNVGPESTGPKSAAPKSIGPKSTKSSKNTQQHARQRRRHFFEKKNSAKIFFVGSSISGSTGGKQRRELVKISPQGDILATGLEAEVRAIRYQ